MVGGYRRRPGVVVLGPPCLRASQLIPGDWSPSPADRSQVTVELKWDGKALSGTVNPGPNAVPPQKATLDPKTNAVHFEADAKARGEDVLHCMIGSKVEKGTMTGSKSRLAQGGLQYREQVEEAGSARSVERSARRFGYTDVRLAQYSGGRARAGAGDRGAR